MVAAVKTYDSKIGHLRWLVKWNSQQRELAGRRLKTRHNPVIKATWKLNFIFPEPNRGETFVCVFDKEFNYVRRCVNKLFGCSLRPCRSRSSLLSRHSSKLIVSQSVIGFVSGYSHVELPVDGDFVKDIRLHLMKIVSLVCFLG